MSNEHPQTVCGDLGHLPPALAPLIALPNWVLWKWERIKNKWTKVPYQPSGAKAKSNDPTTWSSYDTVIGVVEQFDGIGLCLGDDIAAFDIDNCRNPVTGAVHPWAQEQVDKAGSYTEITVSGTGLRIIGRGIGPKIHRKQKVVDGVSLETYRRAERYIVVTGNPLPGSERNIINIDPLIEATVAELDAAKGNGRDEPNHPGTPSDGGHHARASDEEDELERTIRDGGAQRHGETRSEAVWWTINEMLRRGYRPEAIVAVLLERKNKISDHVYDQPQPRKYVERQLAEAKAKIALATNEEGKPYPTQNNIRIALLKLGVSVRYDRFADRTLLDGLAGFGPTLDDAAVNRIWLLLEQRFRFRPQLSVLRIVIEDVARLNGFHPVRDYLSGLKWDGVPRIDRWLVDYGGAEATEYVCAVGALTLIAAVRRVRRPGCKFDEMCVLENDQGTNRSTALQTLAVRQDWFTDSFSLSFKGKEVIEALRGKWIVEVPELSGMRKGETEHVKAHLSRQVDRARLAYGRLVEEVPRQNVNFGTTNDATYLRDSTGNRRFWPVKCEVFELEGLTRDRDQLWAEAAVREAQGESIRMDESLWPVAQVEQEKRLADDPYLEALESALGEMKGKIRAVDVWTILDIREGHRTQDQNVRMSEAMRRLGWERPPGKKLRFGKGPESAFYRGNKDKQICAVRSKDGLTVYLEAL